MITNDTNISSISLIIPSLVSDLPLIVSLIQRTRVSDFGSIIVVVSEKVVDRDQIIACYFPSESSPDNLSVVFADRLLFPGQARNLGVKSAKSRYITFLDARTSPTESWFIALSAFKESNLPNLQLASVLYVPTSFLAEVFVAATYGFLPLTCLPGSILNLETFSIIGNFISARSGEDSEWITRSRLIGVSHSESFLSPLLEYRIDFTSKTLSAFLRKWFQNYASGFALPGYQIHKYFYTFLGTGLALLFFSMWNWRVAGWNENSFLYLPYVTRITLIAAFAVYLFFRAVYLPLIKGIFGRQRPYLLLVFSFPLAILLDLVKVAASFYVVVGKFLAGFKIFIRPGCRR